MLKRVFSLFVFWPDSWWFWNRAGYQEFSVLTKKVIRMIRKTHFLTHFCHFLWTRFYLIFIQIHVFSSFFVFSKFFHFSKKWHFLKTRFLSKNRSKSGQKRVFFFRTGLWSCWSGFLGPFLSQFLTSFWHFLAPLKIAKMTKKWRKNHFMTLLISSFLFDSHINPLFFVIFVSVHFFHFWKSCKKG